MSEEINMSIVGLIILLLGILAAIIMLEAMGRRQKDAKKIARLKMMHRIMAIVFAVLFILVSVGMSGRLKFWHGEPSTRIILHWSLGIAVITLLIAKIVIYNRYPKMLGHMPAMGWFILLSTFILFSVTGGFEMLQSSAPDGPQPQENYTRALVDKKCGHCHSLERVYATEWDATIAYGTVAWMQYISPGWISDDEGKMIAEYLTPRWKLP